jgi:hypothetical protein
MGLDALLMSTGLLGCSVVYLRLWLCPVRVKMIRRDWARLQCEWRGDKYTPPPGQRKLGRTLLSQLAGR